MSIKFKICGLLLFVLTISSSFAQTITSVVGTGTAGYSGDDALSIAAKITKPYDVALDGSGNLYVADANNNVIRKITKATGMISTVAGTGAAAYSGDGGLATSAQLNFPEGITIDPTGNLLIADTRNQVIRKVDASTGIITTVVGNGTFGYTGDGGTATVAELHNPIDVAVDGIGNLYISDNGNYVIRFVSNSTGFISTYAGNGTSAYTGNGGQATSGSFVNPFHVCLDRYGNLFVADNGSCSVIRRIDAGTNIIRTVAGSGTSGFGADGLAGVAAKLNNPTGVSVDNIGNIYISDYLNNRIRLVESKNGLIKTVAGTGYVGYTGDGGGAQGATMNSPMAVVVDNSNNVYFADLNNNVVRKFNSSTMLPLTLLSFTGTTLPSYNTLNWQTEKEIGTKNFAIQSSEDGLVFNSIATIEAKGGGNYRYLDTKPISIRIFYRLKMIDADGNFTYSPILTLNGVSKTETLAIKVYPNPFVNYILIDLSGTAIRVGSQAQIYDSHGKIVRSFYLSDNVTKVDVSSLFQGSYFIKVNESKGIEILKF